MNAQQIRELLARRHDRDVFVPECKNGPTWDGGHLRVDAWAMKRSWANPCYWAYEIKVNRSDFLTDDKWPGYLDHCNEFYFVATSKDIIRLEECPEQAGLIYCSSTGTRLYTKKRAPHRQIEDPVDLLLYLLMSRTKIVDYELNPKYDRNSRDKNFWLEWQKEKKIDREFGHKVSKAVSQRVEEEVLKARDENEKLRAENETLVAVRDVLEKMKIPLRDLQGYYGDPTERFKEKLEELQKGSVKGLEYAIANLERALKPVREKLKL